MIATIDILFGTFIGLVLLLACLSICLLIVTLIRAIVKGVQILLTLPRERRNRRSKPTTWFRITAPKNEKSSDE